MILESDFVVGDFQLRDDFEKFLEKRFRSWQLLLLLLIVLEAPFPPLFEADVDVKLVAEKN